MKKASVFLLIATCAYLLVCLGYFIGRSSNGSVFYVDSYNNPEDTSSAPIQININTDDFYTLMLLDGVGEKIAQRIIMYRIENGPFEEVDELLQVEGMTKSKLEHIRDFITVEE